MNKILTAMIAATTLSLPLSAQAQTPPLIPVQGFLTDVNDTPVDGPTSIRFRLYDAALGGNTLHDETLVLDIIDGLFSAYIGEDTPVDLGIFSSAIWLGVTVEQDEEMERYALGTAPFSAFSQACEDANTVGGMAASDFAPAMHTHAFGTLTDIPAGLEDGDDDTVYTAGAGINIAGNAVAVDQSTVEGYARNVCYDTEGELTAVLDDDYADIAHTHAPDVLDCTSVMQMFMLPPSGTSTQFVNCPATHRVTGGGANIGPGAVFSDFTIFQSFPDLNQNRFNCGVQSTSASMANFECRAICCRVQSP